MGAKGLECGSNGRVIFGGAAFDNEALVRFMGLLGFTARGEVVPSLV